MKTIRLACFALVLSGLAVGAAPEYWPIDLGTLGGTNVAATGINDAGQVVGWSQISTGHTQAYVWASGTLTGLGFLPGGTSSVANAINHHGEIVGTADVSGTNYHAFLYHPNTLVDMGTWGGPNSQALGINDNTEVTGWSFPAPGSNFYFGPYLWRSNQFIGIPPYHNKETAGGLGINSDGYIAGYTVLDIPHSNRTWPMIWWDGNTNGLHDQGEMKVLGTLGGQWGEATAINTSGQIVGWASTNYASSWPRHAFLVTPSNGVWNLPSYNNTETTNLLMRDLGALESPTNNSFANALNDQGWVVGMATIASGTNQAFLWRDGVMTNLNDLIAANSGWVLTNATGINVYNEIVGNGLYYDRPRAFILRSSSGLSVLGTNGLPVLDSETPSLAKGTDFGSVELGQSASNVFILRNLGSSNLAIYGWTTHGTGAAQFEFSGLPSVVEIGGVSNFSVVFSPFIAGLYPAALALDTDSPTPLTNILFTGTGVRHPQTIDFSPLTDQWATNELTLSASASSGLGVDFSVAFGPAQITDGTHLSFSGAGAVGLVANQEGDAYWAPAPPVTHTIVVTKVAATVTLHDLEQTYDGMARGISAITDPTDLAVDFTYDGHPWAPTNAGTYAVTGTIAEAQWEGATHGTLVVAKADQTIDFPGISDQWTTNTVLLSATADSGLTVEFEVLFGPASIAALNEMTFSGIGQVTITASQPGDDNWNPAPTVTTVFIVSKMPAAVTLHDLAQTYDGTARTVTATTDPLGLAVDITYDGLTWAPTNAGTYAVTGTIAEAHWEGVATGLLVVAKADQTIDFPAISDQWTTNTVLLSATADSGLTVEFEVLSGPASIANPNEMTFIGIGQVAVVARQPGDANWNPAPPSTNSFAVSKQLGTVTLDGLEQTYDGMARVITAVTDPADLAVDFTYDGQPWAPTNAGTYAVTGTIAEAHWEGTTNGWLVVAKADQIIDFPTIPDQFITNGLALTATALSGQAVDFALESGPALFSPPDHWHFSTTGRVTVVARQPGDDNWNPAPNVTNVFEVWGLYTLQVDDARGLAEPVLGLHTHLLNTVLTNSTSLFLAAGGTQWVCTGWTLIGHDPATGATNWFVMTVTNNATLTWHWTTNYWLQTVAAPHGFIEPGDSWCPANESTIITATPHSYYHFDHWTNSASGTNNPFALIMDIPKSARAVFAENLASHDTPEWWLAEHGWTNDFDAAALADHEPDGVPTWQEYVADTDPRDSNSYLRITSIQAEGSNAPVIQWRASTSRVYQIHHRPLGTAEGPWFTQQLFRGTDTWIDDTHSPPPPRQMYRVAPLRP